MKHTHGCILTNCSICTSSAWLQTEDSHELIFFILKFMAFCLKVMLPHTLIVITLTIYNYKIKFEKCSLSLYSISPLGLKALVIAEFTNMMGL